VLVRVCLNSENLCVYLSSCPTNKLITNSFGNAVLITGVSGGCEREGNCRTKLLMQRSACCCSVD
jgi:hypothetical protein